MLAYGLEYVEFTHRSVEYGRRALRWDKIEDAFCRNRSDTWIVFCFGGLAA